MCETKQVAMAKKLLDINRSGCYKSFMISYINCRNKYMTYQGLISNQVPSEKVKGKSSVFSDHQQMGSVMFSTSIVR